jgi:hypothetical protein
MAAIPFLRGLCSFYRLKAGYGLADAGKARLAVEDDQGFKERWRVFASADGDPDGLEGLPCLQTKLRSGSAKGLVERIMIKGRPG